MSMPERVVESVHSRLPQTSERKCALVIDASLPAGTIANTVAVLSMSLGRQFPELIGEDLIDADGLMHVGITTVPIPVLKGDGPLLARLRMQARELGPALTVIDVISATRTTKSYEEYAQTLGRLREDEIEYFGLALCGERKTIATLTGSLGLLR